MKILVCDGVGGCGKEFVARVYTSELNDEIEESYFFCPHCSKVFKKIEKKEKMLKAEMLRLEKEYSK